MVRPLKFESEKNIYSFFFHKRTFIPSLTQSPTNDKNSQEHNRVLHFES